MAKKIVAQEASMFALAGVDVPAPEKPEKPPKAARGPAKAAKSAKSEPASNRANGTAPDEPSEDATTPPGSPADGPPARGSTERTASNAAPQAGSREPLRGSVLKGSGLGQKSGLGAKLKTGTSLGSKPKSNPVLDAEVSSPNFNPASPAGREIEVMAPLKDGSVVELWLPLPDDEWAPDPLFLRWNGDTCEYMGRIVPPTGLTREQLIKWVHTYIEKRAP